MTRAHTNVVLDRLRLDTVLIDCMYEGVVPVDENGNRILRYATLFTNAGTASADRFTGPYSRLVTTYWVHGIGEDPQQAEAILERVDAQLINWVPVVAGWRCQRIRPAAAQPILMDDTIKPPLFYGVRQYDLTAYPA